MDDLQSSVRRLNRSLDANLKRWGLFIMDEDSEHAPAMKETLHQRWSLLPHMEPARFSLWVELLNHFKILAEIQPIIEVRGLDSWLTERIIRDANISREAFAAQVGVPVLFWLNTKSIENLAAMAPDLWSWRAGVFR